MFSYSDVCTSRKRAHVGSSVAFSNACEYSDTLEKNDDLWKGNLYELKFPPMTKSGSKSGSKIGQSHYLKKEIEIKEKMMEYNWLYVPRGRGECTGRKNATSRFVS